MAVAPDQSPAAVLVRYLNEEATLDELREIEKRESAINKAKLREALPLRGEKTESNGHTS